MSVKLDLSGWDDFKKKHEQSMKTPPTLTELFPDKFISEHTDFQSLQQMLDASGLDNVDDFLGSEAWSQFVTSHSRFTGWQQMFETASAEWYKRQVGL